MSSTINFDQEDITRLLVDIVSVAEENGLKLPREFGLLIKQVSRHSCMSLLAQSEIVA